MNCLENLANGGQNAIMKVKAAPPNRRSGPGIANFKNQYIFCGGGYDNDFNDL